ncbi:MAG TPA: hypothetical protein VMF11_08980 [Candidatus Baltobacteraceae bacterium]|nr:hypothetical protein [Candidatus Baltobacteraceae bacterium]
MRVVWQGSMLVLIAFGLFWAITSVVHPNIGTMSVPAKARLERSFDNVLRASTLRPGDAITLVRPDGSHTVIVARRAQIPLALTIAILASRLSFLLVAALIVWRRPDDPAARALATFLACYGAAMNTGAPLWAGPPLARFFGLVAEQWLFVIGAGGFVLFACRFPERARSGWKVSLERAVAPLVAFGLALSPFQIYSEILHHASLAARIVLSTFIVYYAALLVTALALLLASFRSAAGADRVRMSWVLGVFAFGFSGLIVMLLVTSALGTTPAWAQYFSLTIVAMPFGLAYVILRHRMLDIGFVVNRALVYTGVSLIVVASFIIFEWLVGHVVEQNSRASTILQLGAALVLGLSARAIHAHVDRWVDDLFFRERHAAEAAVRKFAHEALLITESSDLVAKTVEVAQQNMRLDGCAFYASRENRYAALHSTFSDAPAVDENDYAVLDMRTWHGPVEILRVQTPLPGELALPMIVRGTLLGFLLCGEKASHEAFAPDEREALALLARDAGIALDSLRIRAIERDFNRLAGHRELPGATGGSSAAS